MSLGQDRYRRWYWVLPQCGGVYVEGVESAEPEFFAEHMTDEEPVKPDEEQKVGQKSDECDADAEKKPQTQCSPVEIKHPDNPCSPAVKNTDNAHSVVNGDTKKEETMETDDLDLLKTKSTNESKPLNGLENAAEPDVIIQDLIPKVEIVPDDEAKEHKPMVNGTLGVDPDKVDLLTSKEELDQPKPDPDSFLANQNQSKFLDLFPKDLKTEPETPNDSNKRQSVDGLVHKSISGTMFNNTLNHIKSPLSPNRSAFRSIDSILNPDLKMNNANLFGKQFVSTSMLLSSTPVSANNVYTSQSSLSTKTTNSSWFSVLPKAPCDEKTVVIPGTLQNKSSLADKSAYCNSPYTLQSPSFSSFNLSQHLYGTPNSSRDLSLGDLTRSSTPQFNKTSTPCSSMLGDTLAPSSELENPLEMVQMREAAPIPAGRKLTVDTNTFGFLTPKVAITPCARVLISKITILTV